jgi:hypothetical protein
MMSAFLITITVSLSGWSFWFARPSAIVSLETHERMPSMAFCRTMLSHARDDDKTTTKCEMEPDASDYNVYHYKSGKTETHVP